MIFIAASTRYRSQSLLSKHFKEGTALSLGPDTVLWAFAPTSKQICSSTLFQPNSSRSTHVVCDSIREYSQGCMGFRGFKGIGTTNPQQGCFVKRFDSLHSDNSFQAAPRAPSSQSDARDIFPRSHANPLQTQRSAWPSLLGSNPQKSAPSGHAG